MRSNPVGTASLRASGWRHRRESARPHRAGGAVAARPGARPSAGAAAVEPVALADDALAIRDGLPAALATLAAASATRSTPSTPPATYAPFWTEPGSAPSRAISSRRSASAGAQALPRRPLRRDGAGRRLRRRLDRRAGRARGAGDARPTSRFAGDLSAGIVDPVVARPRVHRAQARARRPRPRCSPASTPRRSPRCCAASSPATPTTAGMVAEKARLEGLAGRETGGRRSPTARRCTPARPTRASPSCAPGSPGSAISPASGEAVDADFDPTRCKAAVERFQRDYGLDRRRRRRHGDARRDQRAGRDPARPGHRQSRADALDARATSARATSSSTSPTSPSAWSTDGKTAWQSRVVVGKTHVTETPEFSGVVSYMVVNPTWHIPDSIAIRDYLPKLQRTRWC